MAAEIEEDEYWPERIIAMRKVTYDVQIVKEHFEETAGRPATFDEILDIIRDYAYNDFSCSHGHDSPDFSEVIIFDPDGEEY